MRNRLLIAFMLAALTGAGTGCWYSSEACQSDSDCNGSKKCLQSGGVVFGNGVCVRPCTTERLRRLCREQGGQCSGEFCVEFDGDAMRQPDGAPPDSMRPDTCTRPDDYEYCRSRGLPCDPENNPVEGRDRCGNSRSVNCNDEIDLTTEDQHCGACGNACDFANADGHCIDADCEVLTCDPGYENKDGDGANGCECEVTEEVCDGRDNDCNGEVDEGDCGCTPDETDDCYTGPDGTAGTGTCERGTWTCQNDGNWGDCQGETTPTADETCGDDNDADCDGVVDEGCSCAYDGDEEGICADQTRNDQGDCPEPDDYEDDESICDGKDNDCDGDVDEDMETRTFYRDEDGDGYGTTSNTTEACSNPDPSVWTDQDGDCNDDNAEQNPGEPEDCSLSEDNNCDGAVNEHCPCEYDGSPDGVCGNAINDDMGNCEEPFGYESPEMSCRDTLDNDCDGDADGDDGDCA